MMTIYAISEESRSVISSLTEIQQAQLDSAINFHVLVNPGSHIDFYIRVGAIDEMPRLTDPSTIDGRFFEGGISIPPIRVTSMTDGEARVSFQENSAPIARYLRLGHPDATPATTRPPAPLSLARRIFGALERNLPLFTDRIRESITHRREQQISVPLPRYPHQPGGMQLKDAIEQAPAPTAPPSSSEPAILFGLHWLQTGGAERWALESIQIAKDAGFRPIIVTDQNSVHPWLTRPELIGCLVITQSFEHHQHDFDLILIQAILESFDVRGVSIHHSEWLTRALPYLKLHRPHIPVVDSLHIIEYLHGGYVGAAVEYDAFIDVHHVISPQLVSWLSEIQGVEPDKLLLAPLTRLTTDELQGFQPRTAEKALTLTFLGRFSRQKRPDLFLVLADRLRRRGVPFRAIMQGDGERRDLVEALLSKYQLQECVELRGENANVHSTLKETDLLVLTSVNEGLTLTTFEAVSAGVPVLSTDVGSQSTIIEGELLTPRFAQGFLHQAVTQIERMTENETLRETAWSAQREQVETFGLLPDAHTVFERLFTQWHS